MYGQAKERNSKTTGLFSVCPKKMCRNRRTTRMTVVVTATRVCVDSQLFKQQHIGSSRHWYNDSLLSWREDPSLWINVLATAVRLTAPYVLQWPHGQMKRCIWLLWLSQSVTATLDCENLNQSLFNLSKSSKCCASLSPLCRLAHYFCRRIWVKLSGGGAFLTSAKM